MITAVAGPAGRRSPGRRRSLRRSAVLIVAMAAVGLVAALGGAAGQAGPVAAHTELLQASPGASQRVGGTLEHIDLAFLEPVSEAVVEVELGGLPLDGETIVSDGTIIRFQLDEPLREAGRYDVAYRMISLDLDESEGGYWFTFAPEAPEALRLGTVVAPRSGFSLVQIVATAVLVACLAGLAFMLLSRLESRRRDEPSSG
jgi:methionine-rich copper-binding protein CopC